MTDSKQQSGRLAGKVAVVLGATRPGNMGQAIARRFLDEGAKIARETTARYSN